MRDLHSGSRRKNTNKKKEFQRATSPELEAMFANVSSGKVAGTDGLQVQKQLDFEDSLTAFIELTVSELVSNFLVNNSINHRYLRHSFIACFGRSIIFV